MVNGPPQIMHLAIDLDVHLVDMPAPLPESFGVDPHFCIGIHLARLEGAILLEEFLAAVTSYELLPAQGTFAESEFQIGWTCLPVHTII